jgi:hypothetical protein
MPTDDPIQTFRSRLAERWLPDFCSGRGSEGYAPDGFVWDSLDALTAFDARWFLIAEDETVVIRDTHYFRTAKSHARLQLFWQDGNAAGRRMTLWYDPLLIIGAFTRLHIEHGWPKGQFGSFAEEFALEFAIEPTGHAGIALEAKKSEKELAGHLAAMEIFADSPGVPEPPPGARRSAYRKVALIRRKWPALLWTIAPGGAGAAFRIDRRGGAGRFALRPVPESALAYDGA